MADLSFLGNATSYLTVPPPPTPTNTIQRMFTSLYTNNAQVYYKSNSLASCGVGTVRNSRMKARRT